MNPRLEALAGPGVSAFLKQCLQHLQLLQVEWQEEQLRLRKMLVMLLLSIGMLICSVLTISALILTVTWDTPFRLLTIGALAAIYSGLAGVAWYRFSELAEIRAEGAGPFSASRREIEADFRLLVDRLKP